MATAASCVQLGTCDVDTLFSFQRPSLHPWCCLVKGWHHWARGHVGHADVHVKSMVTTSRHGTDYMGRQKPQSPSVTAGLTCSFSDRRVCEGVH